jgi:coiled-coil domain-containing protein 12
MASASHSSLDAAAIERKARLAKLASLKRKQPGSDTTTDADKEASEESGSHTHIYISGRNYDVATRGPKLGFENVPSSNVSTLEQQAEAISTATAEQAAKDDAEADKGIDLFKLQPKKPNWDLKRDLAAKMKILDVRTQNAIARLVRERIENAKKNALQKGEGKSAGEEGSEEVGIDGNTLVEGVHLREREEAEDARDLELDDEDET